MNGFKMSSRMKLILSMAAITFVAYNVLLFVIAGFADHEACFWISYVFMLIAFAAVAGAAYMLRNRDVQPRDWMFGYPVLKHSTIFITIELVVSIIFMLLDSVCSGWIAFAVQFLILVIHALLVLSCFVAHDTIVETQTKIKDSTAYIKLLQVDVEMVAEKSSNADVKAAFTQLAEMVRYSDPMSNENLFELEKQITLQVSNADTCITLNDIDGALQCCNRAKLLLTERNKKCKALK